MKTAILIAGFILVVGLPQASAEERARGDVDRYQRDGDRHGAEQYRRDESPNMRRYREEQERRWPGHHPPPRYGDPRNLIPDWYGR